MGLESDNPSQALKLAIHQINKDFIQSNILALVIIYFFGNYTPLYTNTK